MLGAFYRFFEAAQGQNKVRIVEVPGDAVRPDSRTLMQQRGWVRKGRGYRGPYAPKGLGTWHGMIEPAGRTFRVYIYRPPQAVCWHPKFACFHDRGKGWWSINLATPPADRLIDPVIAYVERLLSEALRTHPKERAPVKAEDADNPFAEYL
jgi:hypothetical protein